MRVAPRSWPWGVAATFIAGLLQRFRWIGYFGLVIVLFVALRMMLDGGQQVLHAL